MKPPDALRVFVVDDHEIVRRGILDLLRAEPDFEIAGEAGTVREALELIPDAAPDAVVVDVRLPDGTGIEVCRTLRPGLPDTRWLFLTAHEEVDALEAAVDAGASGYLYKDTFGTELVDALRVVGRGGSLLDVARIERLRRRRESGGRA